jgi:hypothetical protein
MRDHLHLDWLIWGRIGVQVHNRISSQVWDRVNSPPWAQIERRVWARVRRPAASTVDPILSSIYSQAKEDTDGSARRGFSGLGAG